MKLLSVTVPCYNSQDYMRHCVETLLPGGDEVEILIVDDGSKDDTAAIADQLQAQYPTIVRAIHQENAGHGGAVMKGLENATGLYFKVVDSDDWVDTQVLKDLLALLRRFAQQGEGVDMVVSDFVYDKAGARHKKVMRYPFAIPQNKVLRWEEVGSFPKGHYLLMHSVIYRTQLLRESGLDLPRHTFYVDNLFVYVPMAQVKTLYYVDKVFYHYFIGREDQSVQEGVMIRRIDQQLRVNRLMLAQVDLDQVGNKRLRRYLLNYLEIITTISTVLLFRAGDKEHLEKARAFWRDMARDYPRHYQLLSRRLFGRVLNMPGPGGAGLPWPSIGSARRFLALTEFREKSGPVLWGRARFLRLSGGGENPSCGLRLGGRSFIIRTPSAFNRALGSSCRSFIKGPAHVRGVAPGQIAPLGGG
ncbi:MAG: glycosyltransferase family 2 protein [Acutalibacter sp.]